MKNWSETLKELTAQLRILRTDTPDVMKAFSSIAQAALAAKALDRKTKELIAIGISVAIRCDDCIGFHAPHAKRIVPRDYIGAMTYHAPATTLIFLKEARDHPCDDF